MTKDVREASRGALARLAREPLLVFLVIAGALFGANALLHPSIARPGGEDIVISEGRVRQIEEGFRLLAGRDPTSEEREALVDDYVVEEIAYREAMALGLDVDDTVVRRRMRQKLEFLMEDMTAVDEPTDAQLNAWIVAHPDRYVEPARFAIRQILASGDTRGARADADAREMLARLRQGEAPARVGDASILPAATPPTSELGLSSLFGAQFAGLVAGSEGNDWFGPVPSPFGAHLVQVTERRPAAAPPLDDIHERVRTDWIDGQRRTLQAERQANLRKRYGVTIEWPEGQAQAAATPAAGE
jgi:hypothetical protein